MSRVEQLSEDRFHRFEVGERDIGRATVRRAACVGKRVAGGWCWRFGVHRERLRNEKATRSIQSIRAETTRVFAQLCVAVIETHPVNLELNRARLRNANLGRCKKRMQFLRDDRLPRAEPLPSNSSHLPVAPASSRGQSARWNGRKRIEIGRDELCLAPPSPNGARKDLSSFQSVDCIIRHAQTGGKEREGQRRNVANGISRPPERCGVREAAAGVADAYTTGAVQEFG